MSKLDDVLKALNKMLGGSALQKASEMVKSVEIELEKPKGSGEKIPQHKPTPRSKQQKGYSHSFFDEKPLSKPQYEPINQRKDIVPHYHANYQKMRAIGNRYGVQHGSGTSWMAKRFFEQALFIAQLKDTYHNIENCEENFPYFTGLSLRQFRSYVTLRERFMREDYSDITVETRGYLMLFFGELICASAYPSYSAPDTLAVMEKVYAYASTMPSISDSDSESDPQQKKTYFCTALKDRLLDYALCYQMADKVREYVSTERFSYNEPKMGAAIRAFYEQDENGLLQQLSAITPYHICTTAVCKKEPYDKVYPKLFTLVLQRLDEGIRSNKPMVERLFGWMYGRPHTAFYPLEAAVMNVPSIEKELYPWMVYPHDAATGKLEVRTHLQLNSDSIAGVLRCMDYHFRIEVGATKLKTPGTISVTQDKIIEKAVHEFCERHRLTGYETRKKEQQKKKKAAEKKLTKEQNPDALPQHTKVEIDFTKLEGIRKDAASVEERLLSVYEMQAEPVNVLPIIKEEKPAVKAEQVVEPQPSLPKAAEMPTDIEPEWQDFYNALDEQKRQYLSYLVKDTVRAKDCLKQIQQMTGKMPQLILEEINEAALEHIGDTLFETEGDIEIFEDYAQTAARVFL